MWLTILTTIYRLIGLFTASEKVVEWQESLIKAKEQANAPKDNQEELDAIDRLPRR